MKVAERTEHIPFSNYASIGDCKKGMPAGIALWGYPASVDVRVVRHRLGSGVLDHQQGYE